MIAVIMFCKTTYSQKKTIDSTFLGKWRNEKNGINIYSDKVVMLVKNPSWVDSKNEEDKYTFDATRVATSDVFESWVSNFKKDAKQIRVFRVERSGNILKFYISNVGRASEANQTDYYIRGIKPDEGFIKMFEFYKEP